MAVKTNDDGSAPPVARPVKKREHSRYDQDLFRAKNEGTRVRFALACETYLSNEDDLDYDGTVVGLIEQVDRYDIQILIDGVTRVWLKKAMIVCTEVLR